MKQRLQKLTAAVRTEESKPGKFECLGKSYDVVWFQHFHKAGGSSVIRSAKDAGYQFFEPNRNGNPIDDDGVELPIWDLDQRALTDWLQQTTDNNVDIICCEWGSPQRAVRVRKPRVMKIATMRDPKARLISNFVFDVQHGYARRGVGTISDYMNPEKVHTMPDYYTRILTNQTGPKARSKALKILKSFEYVYFLDEPLSWEKLRSFIPGLAYRHSNKSRYDSKKVAHVIESLERDDALIDELCAPERALYDEVLDHFAPIWRAGAEESGESDAALTSE